MYKFVEMLLVSALLVEVSAAFPLTGNNGIVNATVYGVTEEDGYLYMDLSANRYECCTIELIDSEDRVYPASGQVTGLDALSSYNGLVRDTIAFEVPDSVEIKRIKVTPEKSDPFMIEWSGVPEVSGTGSKLKFYGASKLDNPSDLRSHVYTWTFDIKITNTNNSTLTFKTDEILMKDTVGWVYGAAVFQPVETKKLLPNESIRFPLKIRNVGEFSRPSELIFRDLVMDIGAWI